MTNIATKPPQEDDEGDEGSVRTTSQKWARREKIKEKIKELQEEYEQLTADLKKELG